MQYKCNKLDNINKKQIDLGETAELFLNLKELEQEEVKIKTKLTNKTKKNKPKKKIDLDKTCEYIFAFKENNKQVMYDII